MTSNPPTTADGLWVVKYWAPWLDRNHPNPAKPGELRWFTTINGEDQEVDGPGPHLIEGSRYGPLADLHSSNPLRQPRSSPHELCLVLASLPEELRRAYRDGDFTVGMKDADFQVIPTAWVLAAEARWKPDGGRGLSMTAMALDPAGGGRDSAEIARRHGHWYAELISAKGAETADGSATAATVVKHRLDNAPIVVDVGGGYGGAVTLRLKDNDIKPMPFNGANKSHAQDERRAA